MFINCPIVVYLFVTGVLFLIYTWLKQSPVKSRKCLTQPRISILHRCENKAWIVSLHAEKEWVKCEFVLCVYWLYVTHHIAQSNTAAINQWRQWRWRTIIWWSVMVEMLKCREIETKLFKKNRHVYHQVILFSIFDAYVLWVTIMFFGEFLNFYFSFQTGIFGLWPTWAHILVDCKAHLCRRNWQPRRNWRWWRTIAVRKTQYYFSSLVFAKSIVKSKIQ